MLFPICHVASHLMFRLTFRSSPSLASADFTHRGQSMSCQLSVTYLSTSTAWLWKRVGVMGSSTSADTVPSQLGDKRGQRAWCITILGVTKGLNTTEQQGDDRILQASHNLRVEESKVSSGEDALVLLQAARLRWTRGGISHSELLFLPTVSPSLLCRRQRFFLMILERLERL